MKVLFNATTLVMGGALQVAVAFIKQSIISDCDIEWSFAVSRQVFNELSDSEKNSLQLRVTVFDVSPAKSKQQRLRLKKLENSCRVDVVFTLFGPAYVKFSAPHVCGVADGWVTHSSLLAFQSLESVSASLRMLLIVIYKAYWYRKATTWVVEANNAKLGLIKRLRLQQDSIHVIPNTCGQHYFIKGQVAPDFQKLKKIRLLCMSAYYTHKNLEIMPDIARYLYDETKRYKFEFVLTLSEKSDGYKNILQKAAQLGVEGSICNIGSVRVNDGPSVYKKCHIVFLPSLLETFSANYPEAMAMSRPIITTDLPHARSACKGAALYFEPKNARSATEKILQLIADPQLLETLVNDGKKVLSLLPTPEQRFAQYINVIKSQYGVKS